MLPELLDQLPILQLILGKRAQPVVLVKSVDRLCITMHYLLSFGIGGGAPLALKGVASASGDATITSVNKVKDNMAV